MGIQGFETASLCMEEVYVVRMVAPDGDVDRIMAAVVEVAPLTMGAYDSNAFQSFGSERYRPRQGAMAGSEDGVRKRPHVSEVSFQLPRDRILLAAVIEKIFDVHCYQEPVITVEEVVASRTKGIDDSRNPNRWWNTTGDWKGKPSATI